jgi:NadR type nicotinamide-nucleotide adenylyltransferase
MPKAIVLMTALVPTIGHKYLIDFAKNLVKPKDGTVHVIVGTMDREPVRGDLRFSAIRQAYRVNDYVKVHHLHRDVPQEPGEHPDFWNVWRDIVREFVDVKPDDYFVASELYGIDMARVLGCRFMPCNRYRETIPIKGSDVRSDILGNFHYILPEFQHNLRKTVTLFGAESCGKTTMARKLARDLNGWFVPEWAREYLETVGTEVTDERMAAIVEGQAAAQDTAYYTLKNKPWIFQDTDLLSTVGYYRLWGGDRRADMAGIERTAVERGSDLYIVMSDQIPFEQDPLRYGGMVRESSMRFWIDLLEEFGAEYVVAPTADHENQAQFLQGYLETWFNVRVSHISGYRR